MAVVPSPGFVSEKDRFLKPLGLEDAFEAVREGLSPTPEVDDYVRIFFPMSNDSGVKSFDMGGKTLSAKIEHIFADSNAEDNSALDSYYILGGGVAKTTDGRDAACIDIYPRAYIAQFLDEYPELTARDAVRELVLEIADRNPAGVLEVQSSYSMVASVEAPFEELSQG